MARVRIYQLAKEIDISSKEMMDVLVDIGMDVKSPSSTIEESVADIVKQMIAERQKAAEPQPEPVAVEETAAETVVVDTSVPSGPPETVVEKPKPATSQGAATEPQAEPTTTTTSETTGSHKDAHRRLTRKERLREEKRLSMEKRLPDPKPLPSEAVVQQQESETAGERKTVKIPTSITIKDLAERSGVSTSALIAKLLESNVLRSVNQSISSDVASQILEGFNISVVVDRRRVRIEELSEEERENLVPVAPVVTIMGHVDHGKTTLLDNIRNAHVAETEAGQITQRIGAYEVTARGKKIVFLDTPGHEAFTTMRARGAHVTDIAILVVAADDGVMPQTLEAIDHARAANVPIIVAVNKIDKPDANVDRVKHQLSDVGLVPEDWGGDTVFQEVSAREGTGLDAILEMILLVAEMEEIRGNPRGRGKGVVIESYLDPQRGPTATVLVQKGTLKLSDAFVAGSVSGRVRAMFNYKGDPLEKVGPASAVSVIGFDGPPQASDVLQVVADGKIARLRASAFRDESREGGLQGIHRVTLSDLFAQIQKGEVKDLNIVVKADSHGSVEALCQSLLRLEHDEVQVKIIHRAAGNVNESDIMLASASNAIVIAFAVSVDAQAQTVAEREKIDVRSYDVIYHVINDIRSAMVGLLEPVYEERLLGEAEVRALFKSSRTGAIAGCMVTSGTLRRNTIVRVRRNNEVVHEGKLDSLRRVRDDASEVTIGMECGISLSSFNEFQEGDVIQSFVLEEVPRTFAEKLSQTQTRPRAADARKVAPVTA